MRTTAAFLLICSWAAVATAQWPQWRGPTQDGNSVGESLVDKFPEGGPPVLWIRELGQGYSSFAVVNERAYTLTQTLYEQQLICLDAATGETIWTTKIGWPYDGGGLYPGPRSTPAVVGERVFYVTPQGTAGCAQASDGEIVWQVDFQKTYAGTGTEFGYSASPLVIDELVILPVGGPSAGVIALRVADGSLAWKAGKKPASYSTAVPIEWRGEPLVAVLMQNSLCCVHRRTGELWWEVSLSAGYDEHASAPLYREPHLLIARPFKGGATCYELVADEKTGRCKPVEKWDSPQLSNDVASSVLVGETIFGFDLREAQSRLNRPSRGTFRALDWQTGETLWSANEPGQTQLIAAGDKLVGFNDRGEVLLFRASRDNYAELGKAAVFPGEVCWTSPALANGKLLLRTQSRAACIYLGRSPLTKAKAAIGVSDIPKHTRFDPTVLIGAERDYPATKPDADDYWRWGLFGVVAIVAIGGLTMFGEWLLPSRQHSGTWLIFFWSALFVIGATGSRVIHLWRDDYWFTWPLALWAVYQLTIGFSLAGGRAKFQSRERFTSYAVGLMFLALCALYFHLLRWLGLALEWCFLTGFVLTFPLAATCEIIASRAGGYAWARRLAAYLVSFAAYYWASVTFLDWWLS
ncbi:outer membrane protein assembly factor BamB family protein [Anatilimnocola floriformis]|uniref:outer membrane protein assembly factor BamB family protein n=1 Tax=Anatilimnocola floriformis TaxID=2948575 RepID=UPI0020C45068|nr:PQQ-binding-like beta-propeller repeat protein [Anatilimnocola floriformis]